MRTGRFFSCIAVATLFAVASWASEAAPRAVSPGDPSRITGLGTGCPTFSWSAARGAAAYELAAYRIGAEGEAAAEALRQVIAGAALSWTPELGRCLEPGGRYAWTVRALDQSGSWGPWSDASLFAVVAAPSPSEVGRALAILSAYLGQADPERPATRGAASEPRPVAASAGSALDPQDDPEPEAQALPAPDETAMTATGSGTTGAVFGLHGISKSTGAGSVGVAGESTADSGDVAGVYGQAASAAGAAGVFDNTASGDILRGLAGGLEVFSVEGTGAVVASSFTGDGSALTGVDPAAHTHGGGDVTSAVASATALAADGADCAAGSFASGVDASGAAQGCAALVLKGGDTMTGALALPANGLAVGTTQLVASGGLVGIGTAAPTEPLHIAESDPQLILEDTASGADRHILQLGISGGEATIAANHIPAGAHSLGMKLQVRDAGAPLDALQILADGKVGIGTTTPTAKVDVVGGQLRVSGAAGTRLTSIHDQSANAIAGVQGYGVGDPTAAGGFVLAAAKGTSKHIGGVGDNDPYLYIQSDAHDFHIGRTTAFVTVEGVTGEVGIGTMSPDARLEVSSVLKLTPTDSPNACGASLEGGVYYDDSLSELCFCDGSSWSQADGGGAC